MKKSQRAESQIDLSFLFYFNFAKLWLQIKGKLLVAFVCEEIVDKLKAQLAAQKRVSNNIIN